MYFLGFKINLYVLPTHKIRILTVDVTQYQAKLFPKLCHGSVQFYCFNKMKLSRVYHKITITDYAKVENLRNAN